MDIESSLIDLICFFEELFVEHGMNATFAQYLNLLINLVVLTLIIIGVNYLIKNFKHPITTFGRIYETRSWSNFFNKFIADRFGMDSRSNTCIPGEWYKIKICI